jgi:hypothetical protein
MKLPVNKGDIIRTNYETGPYLVKSVVGPCTCPSFQDVINNNSEKLSKPHYHITCSKDGKGTYHLGGYALDENGKIKSVWSDDEIYVEGNVTTQLNLF